MPPRQRNEKPAIMGWNGTAERGREIEQWARDAALLPYAQMSPTGRDDEPYELRVKTQLPDGRGDQWTLVPKGAVVHFGGTENEPEFTIREGRKAAATTFQE